MRENTEELNLLNVRSTEYTDGRFDQQVENTAYILKQVIRSQITRNPRVNGWRSPSPYSVTVSQYPFVYSESQYTRNYAGSPIYVQKCTQNRAIGGGSPFRLDVVNAYLPNSTSHRYEAEVRALNSVANRKGKILESAAELRSSVRGLAQNATSLQNFTVAVVRKDFAAAARALGYNPRNRTARKAREKSLAAGTTFGDHWLNYQFGIKPIIDDMVLALIIIGQDRTIRLKGTGRASLHKHTQRFQASNVVGDYRSSGRVYVDAQMQIERHAYCSLWYEVRSSHLARFNELGAYSVPGTAWALMPMSFVVDWLLPVQDVLQAMTATVGLTFKGGSYTRMARATLVDPKCSYTAQQGEIEGKASVRGLGPILRMERVVYRTPPVPKPFYVKDPLSVFTAVTSLALLSKTIREALTSK